MSAKKSQRGFTLVELVVVLIIMGVIACALLLGEQYKGKYVNNCVKFLGVRVSTTQCSEIESYVKLGWSLKVKGGDVLIQHPADPDTYKRFTSTAEVN